ncbi:DUF4227 family protein [Brevibacillus daliensis]|uniref:DUF4227 family protein n=1 Tax=Brevibacillus daliensis TaxID=2892995 RepID=UPI001E31A967|nr:DUF4227 family protein [Brevibacillus daliensis]
MPVKKLIELIRFFLIFVTCSLLFYGVISYLSHFLLPIDPYDEPLGKAVKVMSLLNQEQADKVDWYIQRLQLFYSEWE